MSDLCRDCRELGTDALATRVMNGGTKVCDRHMRERLRMPATEVDQRQGLKLNEKKQEGVRMDCKCGRDANHRGRCWVRRGLSGPAMGRKLLGGRATWRKEWRKEIFAGCTNSGGQRDARGERGALRWNLGDVAARKESRAFESAGRGELT